MSADTTLTCRDCGQGFVFTSGEQAFYASRGFSEPSRCADCRAARKAQRDGGGSSYSSYSSSAYDSGYSSSRGEREQCWHLPRHEQWVWDGRPLADRTVLVRCYHGLGDTIQFARFLPLLASIAGETIVWAQPALLGLLARLPSVGRLLPLHDGHPNVDYEVDIEIMELAHALRVDTQSLPAC